MNHVGVPCSSTRVQQRLRQRSPCPPESPRTSSSSPAKVRPSIRPSIHPMALLGCPPNGYSIVAPTPYFLTQEHCLLWESWTIYVFFTENSNPSASGSVACRQQKKRRFVFSEKFSRSWLNVSLILMNEARRLRLSQDCRVERGFFFSAGILSIMLSDTSNNNRSRSVA